MGNADVDFDQ